MIGNDPDEDVRIVYYYQALEEVGLNARQLKTDLDRELKSIWRDLQMIIFQEEIAANYQG